MEKLVSKKNEELRHHFWALDDYRDFLAIVFEEKLCSRLGNKAKLAKILGLSSSFITKLLSKKGHLSHEHIDALAKILEFSDRESLALFDKISIAKVSSPQLRAALAARLRFAFDEIYSQPINANSAQVRPPISNLLSFQFLAALARSNGLSLQELAKLFGMGTERAQFILNRLMESTSIDTEEAGGQKRYRLNKSDSKFNPLGAGSKNMFDLSMSVRRMACYSLEKRHPIHLVDGGEHYVSGSFVLPLSDEQIQELKYLFSELSQKITSLGSSLKLGDPNRHLVSICFDLFDTEI